MLRNLRWLPLIPLAACGRGSGDAACGFTAVAGSAILLNQFSVPNSTLSDPPASLPPKLVVRLVAGPANPGIVGKTPTGWVVGMEGTLPPQVHPRFGVLVMDKKSRALGVVLFENPPIRGAPQLGAVSIGAPDVLPLLGLEIEPSAFEDPRCPFFPDSVIR